MPPSYILHVQSTPHSISPSVWTDWYIAEHVPDMVNSKCAQYGSIYRSIPTHPLAVPTPENPKAHPFLALYQSDYAKPPFREANETGAVRLGSEKFFPEGKTCYDLGEFEARNYELLQEYDPKGVGDGPAPYLLTASIVPSSVSDLDAWYREQHLEALANQPGYRRSLRYRAGEAEVGEHKDDGVSFVAFHEFESLPDTFDESVTETEWTKQVVGSAKAFEARVWELLGSEGFAKVMK